MEGLGGPQGMRSLNTYDYVPGGGDPGRVGGGTYTNPRGDGNRDPTIQVGPAERRADYVAGFLCRVQH